MKRASCESFHELELQADVQCPIPQCLVQRPRLDEVWWRAPAQIISGPLDPEQVITHCIANEYNLLVDGCPQLWELPDAPDGWLANGLQEALDVVVERVKVTQHLLFWSLLAPWSCATIQALVILVSHEANLQWRTSVNRLSWRASGSEGGRTRLTISPPRTGKVCIRRVSAGDHPQSCSEHVRECGGRCRGACSSGSCPCPSPRGIRREGSSRAKQSTWSRMLAVRKQAIPCAYRALCAAVT